jgi:hypothetical protein
MGAWGPIGIVVSGVVMSLAAFRFGHPDVGTDRARLRKFYEERDVSDIAVRADLRASLHKAMSRHPAEPYFSLVGALVATRTKSETPLPWLQRSLERSPINPRAHLLLAEVLGTRGALRQALLEFRLAIEQDATLIDPAARLALHFTTKFDDLNSVVPEGLRGAVMLAALGAHAEAAKQPELRSRCDTEAILRDSRLLGPRIRESEMRLAALKNKDTTGTACEDRSKCAREIREHAEALAISHPEESVSATILARLLVLEGKPEDADLLLSNRCIHVRDRADCLRVRLEAAAKTTGAERVDLATREYLGASCLSSEVCAAAATFAAVVREQRGDAASAITLYGRAAREEPTEARWMALAEAASRGGAHAQCVDALEHVATKRGGWDDALRNRVVEERARALGKGNH